MPKNKIITYNPKLRTLARKLRNNSTLSEILLWQNIKGKSYGYEFHRQVPIDNYIVDFYCHELNLAIEIDGCTHDYNFDNDERRQLILESFGITILRFSDIEVKKSLNEVLRVLESRISEIEKLETRNNIPQPPSKGESVVVKSNSNQNVLKSK
jgi:very-short-patch-repair endonuclease